MGEEKAIIRLKNVTKIYKLYENDRKRFFGIFSKHVPYKEMYALKNVSFEVKRGESVALLGRNGAGKSTILKMITEVAYPTKGTIEVNGRVSALLELTSGFDMELTGRENIYMKGQLCGLTNSEIAEQEDAIIKFSGLHEYIDQPVRTYSSGMRARLGFAINVNIRPEILIVDEALSVGDAAFRKKCRKKVDKIIREDNVTMLFVTHSAKTAKEFCSRGIVMVKGKLVYDGDIDSALEEYKKRYSKKKKKATPNEETTAPDGSVPAAADLPAPAAAEKAGQDPVSVPAEQ